MPCVEMLHKLFWVQKAVRDGAGAEVMCAQHHLRGTAALPQLLMT